jgi:hypothetical protein
MSNGAWHGEYADGSDIESLAGKTMVASVPRNLDERDKVERTGRGRLPRRAARLASRQKRSAAGASA